MHHILFSYITSDTRIHSIFLTGYHANIHHNAFEHIEMGAEMSVTDHCSDNYFNDIIALRYPLRYGSVLPGLTNLMRGPGGFQGGLPFSDTSTHTPPTQHPNQYFNLYESYPDQPLHVFTFPNVTLTTNPKDSDLPPPP